MRLTRWLLAVVPLLTLCCVRANAAPCTKSGFSDQLFVIVSAPASPAGTFCVQINEPAPNNPEGNVSMVVDLGEAFKPNGVGVATIFEATPGCVSTGVSSDVVRLNIAADGHTATITYSSDDSFRDTPSPDIFTNIGGGTTCGFGLFTVTSDLFAGNNPNGFALPVQIIVGSDTPEPSSFVLFGWSAVVGLAGAVKKRLR